MAKTAAKTPSKNAKPATDAARDRFGNRPGTQAATINAALTSKPQTAAAVALLVERADKEDKAKADLAEAARKEAEAAKTLSPAEIAGKLVEAELPKPAQARVLKLVEAGADLEESIKEEKSYLEEALKGAKFEGDGSEEKLEESKPIGSRVFRS